MANSKNSPLGSGRLAYSGLLIGAYSGALFSILSFVIYGDVSAPFLFGARHAIHSYAYTVAIYSLLMGFAGIVLGFLLWIANRLLSAIRGKFAWVLLVLPFSTLVPFVFVNAKWQIAQPRNVPLFDEYRIAFLQRSLVICAASGIVLSLILIFSLHRAELLRRARRFHAGFVAAVCIVSVATLVQMHVLHGRVSWKRIDDLSQCKPGGLQVVLIGLDGATWTVLRPLLDEGKLPNLEAFMDKSAFGTLLVYGKAFSPAVWTTVATGVKRSRHGILTHTVLGAAGVTRSSSAHRKVPALWNIVDQAGLKVGLINYMASFPPERVSGFNLPSVTPIGSTPYDRSVWPPDLIPVVSQLVESVPPEAAVDDEVAALNHEVRVLTKLFERFWDPSYSFFAWYTHSTDAVEHRYWNYMHPESFHGTPFEPTQEEILEKGNTIRDHWETVDGVFGRINSFAGPNTVVIVVSDHGMENASTPEVHLSLNGLLARMGFLVTTDGGETDYSKSLAYWPAGSDVNLRATGISINRQALPAFLDGARSYEEVRDHVIDKLRQVRLAGAGKPLFPAVHRSEEEPDPTYRELLSESDVVVYLSAYTRGTDLEESLDLGGQSIPLREVLAITTDVSGAHHPRGVIMARGRPFTSGPVFGRPTLETPVSDVLQRIIGRSERLDGIMSAAKFFGMIDRATTLDIAQTVIYVLGLPAADYMEGRVLAEGLTRGYTREHPGSLIADYGTQSVEQGDEVETPLSSEELERLRSLGYVD